jgi:glucose/arabinose dehydrogenase
MTRAFFLGAGVLGAVLAGSGMPERAQEAPRPARAPAAVAETVRLEVVTSVGGGLTAITHAGDARLFLTLQAGTIRIWDGTQLLPAPFLDLSSRISCCGERGLLSTAFHPAYANNGFFFVDYTDGNGDTVVARYRVSSNDPNRADPASATTLLTIGQPFANHNGGQLQFGPDGFLYVGMGDGGSGNDPECFAQSEASLLGKMLRIDVDQNVSTPPFYGIPPENPFVGIGGPDEAWAKGLRNPWRFSFDRLTGDLFIADVGQGDFEEIDYQRINSRGGENYGWKVMEGTHCGGGGDSGCSAPVPPCGSPAYTLPVLEYDHSGGRCSVTGGYVYRGPSVPEIYGSYIFGDYCSGEIWSAIPQQSGPWSFTALPVSAPNLTTFGVDFSGELYVGTGSGTLYRFAPTFVPTVVPRAPVVRVTPPSGTRTVPR